MRNQFTSVGFNYHSRVCRSEWASVQYNQCALYIYLRGHNPEEGSVNAAQSWTTTTTPKPWSPRGVPAPPSGPVKPVQPTLNVIPTIQVGVVPTGNRTSFFLGFYRQVYSCFSLNSHHFFLLIHLSVFNINEFNQVLP